MATCQQHGIQFDITIHPSLKTLCKRLLHNESIVIYYSKGYPACVNGSFESAVVYLVDHYYQFMTLLKLNLKDDGYTQMSPPPMLDVVWHEHLLDTRGYLDFCMKEVGELLHHDPNRGLPQGPEGEAERNYRICKTYCMYVEHGGGSKCVNVMMENGLWWQNNHTGSVFSPAEAGIHATVPSATTKEKKALKRKEAVPVDDILEHAKDNEAFPRKCAAEPSTADRRLKLQKLETFDIFVKSLTGKTTKLSGLHQRSTMFDVATLYEEKEGVPWNVVKLVHNGKIRFGKSPGCNRSCDKYLKQKKKLMDEEKVPTLDELGIRKETTLHAILGL
ncbi:hypothetical protein CYMTET_44286 [Cymbomonas tetramitiformis]|uniref:Ubiquitin-like domain-containing protein n=1 Tax=Cymbomonas tetramitiformis TaxID=36881 RepID=A0AAE0EZQ7_9CHLO|nr:hypothetical protein CYMTET_44286 [Cymbomonas tetramitiformis]